MRARRGCARRSRRRSPRRSAPSRRTPGRLRAFRATALAAAAVLAGACSDGPSGPGTLEGTVQAPVPAGAALVELRGGSVVEVEGTGTTRVFSGPLTPPGEGSRVHRVVLVGSGDAPLTFRVRVRDLADGVPTAALLSAVDAGDLAVPSLAGWTVRLAR